AAVVGLVPKAGAARVPEKVLPPYTVRVGASPLHEGVDVAPVLAHADMHREQGIDYVFVAEEAVGLGCSRICELWAESEESLDSGKAIDAHTEIDDDKIGISGKIHRTAVNLGRHKSSHQFRCGGCIKIIADGSKVGLKLRGELEDTLHGKPACFGAGVI